jgi:hypothetical protein
MSKDQDENSNNADNLPDIEKCSVKLVVDDPNFSVVECLVDHPLCNYMSLSLAFGDNLVLCRHPRRKEIIEKMQASVNAASRAKH